MTTNNEEYRVIEDISEEHKEGLKIVEEDEFENSNELTQEEIKAINEFYEENKDTIDLIGGIDAFNSLLEVPDEDFKLLEPHFLAVFKEALNETNTETEFRTMILELNYSAEEVEQEFGRTLAAIDSIDFLPQIKKDFLRKICIITTNKLQEIVKTTNKIIRISCQLDEGVQLPVYAHKTDAGLDIYAREEITINPGEIKIIGTGIKTAIPEGYAILIQPRSGQSVKTKLRIANTPGLIDSGYRDEIGVIIENIEPPFKDIDYEFDDNGEIHIKSILHGQAYTIAEGQRFAQMRLVQVPKAEFVQVESVGEIGENRGGGFGSTGIG